MGYSQGPGSTAGPEAMKLRNFRFFFAGALLLCVGCEKDTPPTTNRMPRAIAHAMGGIEKTTYTNSLEAFQLTYANGCRYLEADLWVTADAQLVLFHDGLEGQFKIREGFTAAEYSGIRIFGKFTPIGMDSLTRLFVEKPDWYLVTDVKNDQRQALTLLCAALHPNGVDCRERVIPQIYNTGDDLEIVKKIGFRRVIFALYRMGSIRDDDIVQFARKNPEIVAITMPKGRWNKKLVARLSELGVKTYLHTINGAAETAALLKRGVWGVYTDYDCGAPDPGVKR